MQIIDVFDAEGQVTFYTVSLEPGFFVDVKLIADTGLAYVMENEDGSTVYGEKGTDSTFPDFVYNQSAIIDFVKAVHRQDLGFMNPLTYDGAFAEREDLKDLVDVLSPQECADLLGRPVWDGSVIVLPADKSSREGQQADRKASLKDQLQLAGKKCSIASGIWRSSKEQSR